MDANSREKLINFLLFLFLATFPFGQLLTFDVSSFGIRLHLIDLLVLPFLFLINPQILKNKSVFSFLYIVLFSSIFSFFLFPIDLLIVGFFYLIRLLSYIAFFIVLREHFAKSLNESLIKSSLLAVSLISAVFGWYQYFFYSDLRGLYYFGWDDHWYRLLGTFLDPGFLGIIIVFGFLIAYETFLVNKSKFMILVMTFLGVSLAFTYSRASFLAFGVGIFLISILHKHMKQFILIISLFALLLVNLPRPPSAGVELERTFSIEKRIQNYKESIEIIKGSPVLGVGFNNFCVAKGAILHNDDKMSHSCSGMDSSVLMILGTLGVIGLLFVIKLIGSSGILKLSKSNSLLVATIAVLIIHSQFSNSLFYPWVMGWISILTALFFSRRKF